MITNKSLKNVVGFKYLGMMLTNQSCIREENKGTLKFQNVCYDLVQNLLSSCLLSKNLKIEIYKPIILPDMTLEVFMVMKIQVIVFWIVTSCNVVIISQHRRP